MYLIFPWTNHAWRKEGRELYKEPETFLLKNFRSESNGKMKPNIKFLRSIGFIPY